MFNCYTVAFFGHRYIENPSLFEKQLQNLIQRLIDENEFVEFLVGKNGDFDRIVSSIISRLQKERDDNSSHILVLPYSTTEYLNNKKYFEDFYNEIRISYTAEIGHPKSAFLKRNREMIDLSDLIVCYVRKNKGGAYQALKYATASGKIIINLANDTNI